MIPVNLGQVADDTGGELAGTGAEETLVTAVTIDSRGLSGGELFVAIPGERVDGHDYARHALDAGAAGVLVENLEKARATGADPARLIAVASTQDALGDLARAHLVRIRAVSSPLVVGVTGSVGKTTTKDLLAALLQSRGPIIAPPGSFNNELGLPLTVLRADAQTATLVLEMGADKVGNLEHLTSIAPLNIGAVLAVARAHLGEFGGIDNVAKAKAELVSGILPGGTAVLNADDERVAAMSDKAEDIVYFSRQEKVDVWASDVTLGPGGHASFTLHSGDDSAEVALGLVGEHHVSNALAAASIGLVAGMNVDDVARGLSGVAPASPHRMDVWQAQNITVIDDSYNANPDSMRAGIRALHQLGEGGRRTAVLGAMLELGPDSDREHRDIGTFLGELHIDRVIVVDAPALADGAERAGVETTHVADIDEAWPVIRASADESGTILFKGSNGSKIWQLADRLKETMC